MLEEKEEKQIIEFRKIKRKINKLEMELEWAESQIKYDYRYISELEKKIEDLYLKLDAIP